MTIEPAGVGASPHAPIGKQPLALDGFAEALATEQAAPVDSLPDVHAATPAELTALDGAHFFDHLERAASGSSSDGLFIRGFTVEHSGTFGLGPAAAAAAAPRRLAVEKPKEAEEPPARASPSANPAAANPAPAPIIFSAQQVAAVPGRASGTRAVAQAAEEPPAPDRSSAPFVQQQTGAAAVAARPHAAVTGEGLAQPNASTAAAPVRAAVAAAVPAGSASVAVRRVDAPASDALRSAAGPKLQPQPAQHAAPGAPVARTVDVAPAVAPAPRPAAAEIRAAPQLVAVAAQAPRQPGVPLPAQAGGDISRIKQPARPGVADEDAGPAQAQTAPGEAAPVSKEAAPGQKPARAPGQPEPAERGRVAPEVAATTNPAATDPAGPKQAPKLEAKEAVKQAEPAKPAQAAALRDSAPAAPAHAPPVSTAAAPAPAPAAARIEALDYDPSLRMTMKPGDAHVTLDAGGGVSLHVQVQNGVANVRAEGAAAPLLGQNLVELRASLASNGLSLGGFERGDSKEREQPEEADATTPAGKPIANLPSRRSSKSRLEVEA